MRDAEILCAFARSSLSQTEAIAKLARFSMPHAANTCVRRWCLPFSPTVELQMLVECYWFDWFGPRFFPEGRPLHVGT
jgi:hypothetical protein